MALLYCQFQSCWANALEDSRKFPGEFRSIVGCNPNVVHVLNTLVSFNNWVELLTYRTWKGRHGLAQTLCKSFVGRSSASKIECKQFRWPLVRHLQIVMTLRPVWSAEWRLPCQLLCCVCKVLTGWLLLV